MNSLVLPAAVTVLLTACASTAPDLPIDRTGLNGANRPTLADLTAAEAAMTCDQVRDEKARYTSAIQQANSNVEANRVRNQTAAYIASLSVLTLPVLLATEGNYADKDAIFAAYNRIDRLNLVSSVKQCPAALK